MTRLLNQYLDLFGSFEVVVPIHWNPVMVKVVRHMTRPATPVLHEAVRGPTVGHPPGPTSTGGEATSGGGAGGAG